MAIAGASGGAHGHEAPTLEVRTINNQDVYVAKRMSMFEPRFFYFTRADRCNATLIPETVKLSNGETMIVGGELAILLS